MFNMVKTWGRWQLHRILPKVVSLEDLPTKDGSWVLILIKKGKNLVSCGFDKCVRVWNLETSEREATINISITDLDDASNDDLQDESVASGVKFIGKGVRGVLVVIVTKGFA